MNSVSTSDHCTLVCATKPSTGAFYTLSSCFLHPIGDLEKLREDPEPVYTIAGSVAVYTFAEAEKLGPGVIYKLTKVAEVRHETVLL